MDGYISPERPKGYPEWSEEAIYVCFCQWMKNNYSIDVVKNEKYSEIVREIIFGILSAPKENLTVIPASMGIGKSTLLMVFAKFMAVNDPEFGCIIVKERLEDMNSLESQLGYVDDTYGEQKICFAWKGFNAKDCLKGHEKYAVGMCTNCDSSVCSIKFGTSEQSKYPVVIISHERLFLLSDTENLLKSLKKWKDEYGVWHERKYIFIDEKPRFFETYKLGDFFNSYNTFFSELKNIVNAENIQINLNSFEYAGSHIFYNIPNNQARETPQNTKLFNKAQILNDLRIIQNVWWKTCSEENIKLFPIMKNLFENGGYRSTGANKIDQLTTYQYSDYIFPEYRTIVLDGTAIGDMIYPKDMTIVDVDGIRTYENVTINHCNKYNLSKSYLKNKGTTLLGKLSQEIVDISKTGKTLVICHNEYENKFKKLLQNNDNIMVGHFNALKGSNNFIDCVNIFFAGTIDFGDEYYVLKAMAIDKSKITYFDTINENSKHTFLSEFINTVERNDKEKYILQDIFRIALRKIDFKEPINAYIYQTDNQLIENIASQIPGCIVNEWIPEHYISESSPVENKIRIFLEDNLQYVGDVIRKKEFEEALNISKDTRKEIFNKDRFKQFMSVNNIISKGQKIIKTNK